MIANLQTHIAYRCPECGSDYIKVTMNVPLERVWKGDELEAETEEDFGELADYVYEKYPI